MRTGHTYFFSARQNDLICALQRETARPRTTGQIGILVWLAVTGHRASSIGHHVYALSGGCCGDAIRWLPASLIIVNVGRAEVLDAPLTTQGERTISIRLRPELAQSQRRRVPQLSNMNASRVPGGTCWSYDR